MKSTVLLIAAMAILFSCKKPDEEKSFQLVEDNAIILDVVTPEETEEFLENNPYVVAPDYQVSEDLEKDFELGKGPQPFRNEELPHTFKNRTFINLSSLTYKLDELPGNIVKYDSATNNYKVVTLSRLMKDNQYPELKIIEDGIMYSSKINSGANFNGSFLIAGLTVEKNRMMELIIQDVMLSIVPDSLMLKEEILKIAGNLDPKMRPKYFFVKGTVLTLINNKKFSEQKFKANINNTYVTAEGNVFASNEKFSRERLVSMDLISLDDILIGKDSEVSLW